MADRIFCPSHGRKGACPLGPGSVHGEPLGEAGHVIEQRFSGEGMAARVRHEARWFGTDSVSMRSFDGDLHGDWCPRREYTWVRAQRTPPG
jgi:hypothetical protein